MSNVATLIYFNALIPLLPLLLSSIIAFHRAASAIPDYSVFLTVLPRSCVIVSFCTIRPLHLQRQMRYHSKSYRAFLKDVFDALNEPGLDTINISGNKATRSISEQFENGELSPRLRRRELADLRRAARELCRDGVFQMDQTGRDAYFDGRNQPPSTDEQGSSSIPDSTRPETTQRQGPQAANQAGPDGRGEGDTEAAGEEEPQPSPHVSGMWRGWYLHIQRGN
jgi:hypothetical protein